jgi:hypothetical protein
MACHWPLPKSSIQQLVASKIIDETDAAVPHKRAAPVKWYYYNEDFGGPTRPSHA